MHKLSLVQKEYKVLDVMKFVMAIVVVAIHTRPEMSFSSPFVIRLFESVYSIAVPFFFMASGFLLFRKISLPLNEDGELRIKSYLKRMCRLYLVWTIIYLPLTIYGFYIDGLSPIKAVAVFIRNTLLVGENFMSWPLWYLLALIVAVSIIYILLKLKVSKTWIVIIGILMAFIGVGLDYCHANQLLNPIVDLYFKVFLKTRNGFFVGLMYVALGLLCAKLDEIPFYTWVFIFILGIVGVFYNCPLSNALVTFALFIITTYLRGRWINLNASLAMRTMSTIVYFTHMVFMAIGTLWVGINKGLLLFVVVILVSVIMALMLQLFGNKSFLQTIFE